jgi:hypothetical protein
MDSSSNDRFKNSRDRLDRAEYHAKLFYSQWESLLEKDGFSAIGRYDETSRWSIVRAEPTPTMIEKVRTNTLAIELGEMAYQLRAALDGLIWETITIFNGAEPAPDADGVNRLEFPILNGKNADFKKCAFYKFPFPNELRDWLESIQPGSAEKPVGDPYRGLKTTLEDIHDLARHDRHRRLRVVGAVPREINFRVDATSDPISRTGTYEMIETCDLLGGKHEFLRFQIITASGIFPQKIHLSTNIRIDIFVEQIELYNGENLGIQLQRFIQAVGMVIEKFEKLVP